MLGSKNAQAIEDMVGYAQETQHEKILRGLAVGIALVMYGRMEEADALIESLCRDKVNKLWLNPWLLCYTADLPVYLWISSYGGLALLNQSSSYIGLKSDCFTSCCTLINNTRATLLSCVFLQPYAWSSESCEQQQGVEHNVVVKNRWDLL